MKRRLLIGIALIISVIAIGQQKPPGGRPEEPPAGAERERPKEEPSRGGLTREEREIIRKARSPNASATDKEQAEDICKKKCPECFNGQRCDLKCAEENC